MIRSILAIALTFRKISVFEIGGAAAASEIQSSTSRVFEVLKTITSRIAEQKPVLGAEASISLLKAVDLVAMAVLTWAVSSLYLRWVYEGSAPDLVYSAVGFLASILFVMVNQASGLYRRGVLADPLRATVTTTASWLFIWLFIVFFGFMLKFNGDLSRASLLLSAAAGVPLIGLSRVWLAGRIETASRGDRERAGLLWLGDAPNFGRPVRQAFKITCACVVPLDQGETGESEAIRGFISAAQASGIDRVLISMKHVDMVMLSRLLPQLRALKAPITLCADEWTSKVYGNPVSLAPDTVGFELAPAKATDFDNKIKRVIDLAVTCSALPFVLPVMAAIAIAIKRDSKGPILFRQRRRGLDGREFVILKFRTMNVLEDGDFVRQATKGDDRVTRLGRLLRASSLDELPQLFNVLRGEMSLVGPRPHAIAHDDYYDERIEDYPVRRYVKPGLTGWAQINGSRGETSTLALMEQRIELDKWYVFNWTFWLDLRILFATVASIIRQRDVY